jgi:Leucine-rich repeat (LRR) protein
MKYIKEYNHYLDPYGEEDWDEVEFDGTFYSYLKIKYPDESKWNQIKQVDCSNQNLTSLEGIKNLKNLKLLYCYNNQLTELNIENLINLKRLWCSNNQLISLEGIENLKNLKKLFCSNNQLTNLEGIENLKNLKELWCSNNNFLNEYINYLINYCKLNKIYILI